MVMVMAMDMAMDMAMVWSMVKAIMMRMIKQRKHFGILFFKGCLDNQIKSQ